MASSLASALPLPYFNVAQVFYVSAQVSSADTVVPSTLTVTSIDLYFKYKPPAIGSSGISNPGVTLYLAPTSQGYPLVTPDVLNNFARCTYNQIVTSSDGSVATKFMFTTPVNVTPNLGYAILLSYDGNDTFVPWTATQGNWLAGTTNYFSGTFNNLIGDYFEYVDLTGGAGGLPSASAAPSTLWRPMAGTSLTFDVYCAQYVIDGTPAGFFSNTANGQGNSTYQVYSNGMIQEWNANTSTISWIFPQNTNEGIAFDLATSTVQSYIGAQRVWQNTFSYPGGYSNNGAGGSFVTVSCTQGSTTVTANSQLPNGQAFNWKTIFPSQAQQNFIVLKDSTGIDIRKVISIASNTVMQVDEPITFTNTAAKFALSPVATVSSTIAASPLGYKDNFLFLTGSNANQSIRFVNNSIQQIQITNGGSGYSNSDVLYLYGYEYVANKIVGGYPAVANIVTNGSGTITNVYHANIGCGFVYPANVFAIIANTNSPVPNSNTSANTSTGSGATFAYTIGATISTEMTNNIFQQCTVTNMNLDYVVPYCNVSNPLGTNYDLVMQCLYYMNVDNTSSSGYTWFVNGQSGNAVPQTFVMNLGTNNPLVSPNPVAYVSYSNEFITPFASGATRQVNATSGYSNGLVLQFNSVIKNPLANVTSDYQSITFVTQPSIEFGHYIINDSYYDEYTNSGNAWARHLTTLINFNNFSEDLKVYLTVYKPQFTDFAVFAKVQNANDLVEPFASEDWTMLQLEQGQGLVSSTTDRTDYVELVYGFPLYPNGNTALGANTKVTWTSPATTVTGNTTTANSVVTVPPASNGMVANNPGAMPPGTMVRIYNKFFATANNDEGVYMVVASNTSTITVDGGFSTNTNIGGNPAMVGPGMSIDILGYPHQAFNNQLNANTVRYYNDFNAKYDGFNQMQLKIVMLSNAYSYVPEIVNIRALGVSA